jgi:hypothetical protein
MLCSECGLLKCDTVKYLHATMNVSKEYAASLFTV